MGISTIEPSDISDPVSILRAAVWAALEDLANDNPRGAVEALRGAYEATETVPVSHERHALLVLRAVLRQEMLDQFGHIRRIGCYDLVCRGIDGEPLPPEPLS